MKQHILTPEEQERFDSSGLNKAKARSLMGVEESFFEAPSRFYRITPDEMFTRVDSYVDRFAATNHSPWVSYDKEMRAKRGPQGGMFNWDSTIAQLSLYYEHANAPRICSDRLVEARDYLMRRIKERMQRIEFAWTSETHSYEPTFAGTPTGLHKGDFLAECRQSSITTEPMPTILGQRRMRGKDRLIFMDSVQNVRYIEKKLSAMRKYLREQFPEYFGSWLNPFHYVKPTLTQIVDQEWDVIEADYEGMDYHFSKELVEILIVPILEQFHFTPTEVQFILNLFEQAVYMGDFLYTGLHNLFSGQVITNDFETIYSVILAIATAIEFSILDEYKILALGDDQVFAVRNRKRTVSILDVLQFMRETSSDMDMLIHGIGKTRVTKGEVRYLREVYYSKARRLPSTGVIIGAYPPALTINNIVQPEYPSSQPAQALKADLQRLDGLAGTCIHTTIIDCVKRFSLYPELSAEALATVASRRDWWEKLYGERWNPESSKSARYWFKMNN